MNVYIKCTQYNISLASVCNECIHTDVMYAHVCFFTSVGGQEKTASTGITSPLGEFRADYGDKSEMVLGCVQTVECMVINSYCKVYVYLCRRT